MAAAQGTLVAAITYDKTIANFSRILQPYKKYLVSNAGLKDADPEYQLGEYAYSWTLHGRTPVDPYNESIPASLPCTLDFVKFEDMYKYADLETPETSLAIRVLVVASCFVPDDTNNSICDYIVINKEKTIMTLRLWGDSLDNDSSYTCLKKQKIHHNAPLNDEIERRINRKPVICFVKHHEKKFRGKMERSHLIMKLYTEQEIAESRTPQNTKGSSSSDGMDSSLLAPQIGEKEKQFFSPKTKLVIENIADATGIEQGSFPGSSSPKRSLLFIDIPAAKLDPVNLAPSLLPTAVEKTHSAGSEIQQSPGKKVKGKEIENI